MITSEYSWFNYNVNPASVCLFECWQRPDTCRFNYSTIETVEQLRRWKYWQAEVGVETTGAEVVATFIDKDWAQYWLYAPVEKRLGQQLYMAMLQQLFPTVIALPSKNSFGLPPAAVRRIYIKSRLVVIKAKLNKQFQRLRLTRDIRANYLDYAAIFRQRKDYKDVLQQAFKVLIDANIFNVETLNSLQRKHKPAQAIHAEHFCLLIGLAANIDAGIL
jgi:hypothetical protein